MFDQALDSAEACRVHKELYSRRHTERLLAASPDQEGEHAPEAFHLALGDSMANMRGEPRIIDGLDCGTSGQRRSDRRRIRGVSFHPTGQRAEPSQDQPGVERRGHYPQNFTNVKNLVEEFA